MQANLSIGVIAKMTPNRVLLLSNKPVARRLTRAVEYYPGLNSE